MYNRRISRKVFVGGTAVGGGSPVTIQSMTNTDTADVKATVAQINRLEEAGCEIVRVAVPNTEAADAIAEIKKNINIPLVADIHFDYRLALRAAENGADKLRINPGNIGSKDRIRQVVDVSKERHIPIRIGVNSGSLEKDLIEKYGGVSAEGLAESALRHIGILEDFGFYDTIIAIKASKVKLCLDAYSLLADKVDYPFHIGVTESGSLLTGSVKSACGIASLLTRGLGDTLRVSLSADPVHEIHTAKSILQSLELRVFGPEFIFCPTCGRTEIKLIELAEKVEKACLPMKKNIRIAVMGCAVNGPGEAREADVGIAGGNGCGLIFKKGKIIKKVAETELLEALLEEIEKL